MGNQQARRMASATLGGEGSTRHLEDSLNVPPEANTPSAPLSYGWVKVCIEAHGYHQLTCPPPLTIES